MMYLWAIWKYLCTYFIPSDCVLYELQYQAEILNTGNVIVDTNAIANIENIYE